MKNNSNFLDCVFEISPQLAYHRSEDGEYVVTMENKGFANRVAQHFFKRPERSDITLAGMGSFIFGCIDGKRTVHEIGKLLHEEYKEDAEPLYERLSVYMKKLESFGFIRRVT